MAHLQHGSITVPLTTIQSRTDPGPQASSSVSPAPIDVNAVASSGSHDPGQQVDFTSLMSAWTSVLNADSAVLAAARVSAEGSAVAAWALAPSASQVVATAST